MRHRFIYVDFYFNEEWENNVDKRNRKQTNKHTNKIQQQEARLLRENFQLVLYSRIEIRKTEEKTYRLIHAIYNVKESIMHPVQTL